MTGKPAGLVLLMLGLILGPGYYIYTRFYTGREITELPLEFQTQADKTSIARVNVDLLPVMGPVTIIVNMTASYGPTLNPPDTPKNRYQATIMFNDEPVLAKSFSFQATQVESTPAQVFRHALPVMHVSTPGKYTLELIQEAGQEMEISRATIQVRAGVKSLNTSVLASGIALLVAGAALLAFVP
jgi:hypothetical protein